MRKRGRILTRRCKQVIEWIHSVPTSLWLVGILIIGGGLNLLSWHWEPTISRDSEQYIRLGQIWHETGSFQSVMDAWHSFLLPPLPIYLIKCLLDCGVSAENAGILPNIILGSFIPLFSFGIAYEITQRKDIAVCSALLMAVSPSVKSLSIEAQRDIIYLFFAGCGLWLLVAGIRRQKWGYWFGAGLACGCGMLARFETAELLAIVPSALFLLCMEKYNLWRKSFFFLILYLLGFFAIIISLSFVMQAQNVLISNYKEYYHAKYNAVKTSF